MALQANQTRFENAAYAREFLSSLSRQTKNFANGDSYRWNRLVCIQDKDDGAQEVLTAAQLGLTTKSEEKFQREDVPMVESLLEQALQGRLYVYDLDAEMPRKVDVRTQVDTVDGKTVTQYYAQVPTEPIRRGTVQLPQPLGWWKTFANTVTFGRAYREEFRRYNEQRAEAETKAAAQARVYDLFEGYKTERRTRIGREADDYQAFCRQRDAREKLNEAVESAGRFAENNLLDQQRTKSIFDLRAQESTFFRNCESGYIPGQVYELPPDLPFTDEELQEFAVAASLHYETVFQHKCFECDTPEGAMVFRRHLFQDILTEGRSNSERFFPMLDTGRQKAYEALQQYAQGDPTALAALLKNAYETGLLSLRTIGRIAGTDYVEGAHFLKVCDILEKHPDLRRACGLTEDDLKDSAIEGYRNTAEVIRKSHEARQEIARAATGKRKLSDEEKSALLADILAGLFVNERSDKSCLFRAAREDVDKKYGGAKKAVQVKLPHDLDAEACLATPVNSLFVQMAYPLTVQAIREGTRETALFKTLMAQKDPVLFLAAVDHFRVHEDIKPFMVEMATARTNAASRLIREQKEKLLVQEGKEDPEAAPKEQREEVDEMAADGPQETMILA